MIPYEFRKKPHEICSEQDSPAKLPGGVKALCTTRYRTIAAEIRNAEIDEVVGLLEDQLEMTIHVHPFPKPRKVH